jgi:hypothetical protein
MTCEIAHEHVVPQVGTLFELSPQHAAKQLLVFAQSHLHDQKAAEQIGHELEIAHAVIDQPSWKVGRVTITRL